MNNLKNIQEPLNSNEHKIVSYQRPLPNHPVDKNVWLDKYNILYELDGTILNVSRLQEIKSLVSHLNKIDASITIHFHVKDVSIFNELCRELNRQGLNKNAIIYLMNDTPIKKLQWLDFELLPNNVKVSNNEKEDMYPQDNAFDWWLLWLNSQDFNTVVSKLTPIVAKRSREMRSIVDMLKKYPRLLRKSSLEKTNIIFDVLSRCTKYDYSATNNDGTLKDNAHYSQDPLYTYKNGTGVCAGRARLMRVLLNNYLMQVECFLASGMYGPLQHEWNEVYIGGEVFYYDLSFARKNCPNIELTGPYHDISHSDANRCCYVPKKKVVVKQKKKDGIYE